MPIKFPCPHCKVVLSVKDHLAGKKGPCPKCKKVLSVPLESTVAGPAAPTPVQTNGKAKSKEPAPPAPELPPVDAEAAAAAALADEPPPVVETKAPQFVDFNCPFCDEALHMSADVAGKRVPCPECKRIVKVPELKKIEKADWRKTNAQGLPSGARRPDEPVPEGAWGTQSAGTVSREALEEAEVLPDKYHVPLTARQKIARGIMIGTAVIFAFILVGVAYSWWASSRETRTLKTVEDYANSPAATEKIGREGVAALYVALGEYHLRSNKPSTKDNPANKDSQPPIGVWGALRFFDRAIDRLTPQGEGAVKDNERDAILADIAVLEVDLGGSKEEVDQTTRLSWNDTQGAVGKTLRAMRNPDARLAAFRAVCRRLLAKNEAKRAHALARQISDVPAEKAEALAVCGLEMFAANQKPLAETAAAEVLTLFPPEGERPLLTPSVVALAVVMNHDKRPEPSSQDEKENNAIGQAQGSALLGKWDEARQKAATVPSSFGKLQAYVALAAAGEAKSDNPDLQKALELATGGVQRRPGLVWLKLHVVDLAARAGVEPGQLDPVIASIEDRDLAGRARLAVLRQKLAAKNAVADSPLLSESPPTLSHYLAVEMIARQQGKFDAGKAEEADRPFGVIGVMLGN